MVCCLKYFNLSQTTNFLLHLNYFPSIFFSPFWQCKQMETISYLHSFSSDEPQVLDTIEMAKNLLYDPAHFQPLQGFSHLLFYLVQGLNHWNLLLCWLLPEEQQENSFPCSENSLVLSPILRVKKGFIFSQAVFSPAIEMAIEILLGIDTWTLRNDYYRERVSWA